MKGAWLNSTFSGMWTEKAQGGDPVSTLVLKGWVFWDWHQTRSVSSHPTAIKAAWDSTPAATWATTQEPAVREDPERGRWEAEEM